jgi:hypothetical protein
MRSIAGPAAGAVLAGFFTFSPAAAAQPARTGPATFAVRVTDGSGNPISNVRVSLTGPVERASSTEGGRIAFENLPVGKYQFRFEHPDFETLTKDVVAKRGAPVQVEVALTAKPAPPPQPPPAPAEPQPGPATTAEPVVLDLPTFIEKHYVGKSPSKDTPLGCGADGTATLIQLNEPLPLHSHDDADEFVYVMAGQGTLQVNGREEPLAAGAFVVIPRGVQHAFAIGAKKPLVMISTRSGGGCGK